jgi:hypothetical protein
MKSLRPASKNLFMPVTRSTSSASTCVQRGPWLSPYQRASPDMLRVASRAPAPR